MSCERNSSRDHCKSLFNNPGNILISDQFNNRVIETTGRGEIVWQFGLGPTDASPNSIIGVNDAQRIGDLTLMAGTGTPAATVPNFPNGVVDNRVLLVNKRGQIIWQYGQFGQSGTGFNLLNTPVQNTFVPNCNKCGKCKKVQHNSCGAPFDGTILITDQGNQRIIRVNADKLILWQFPTNPPNLSQLNTPNSAEQLENGFILIADEGNNRAIEVNPQNNQIVKIFTAGGSISGCAFASRLENGNTLLTDSGNSRIVEVNSSDQIVWQYLTNQEFNSIPNPLPTRGLRLKNGDTIISDQFNNRVIRVNQTSVIKDYYGLPLSGGPVSGFPFGNNVGYSQFTTQLGLFSPYDAKIIGDYTGITSPKCC